jgi:hypothetical protein
MNSSCFLILDVRIMVNINGFTDIILHSQVRFSLYYVLANDDLQDNEDGEKIQFCIASLLIIVR